MSIIHICVDMKNIERYIFQDIVPKNIYYQMDFTPTKRMEKDGDEKA